MGQRLPPIASKELNCSMTANAYRNRSSDPESPNYGKHKTLEEVIELFKPSEDTIEKVFKWLITSGIARERITHSDNKAWLAFDATRKEAEDLLHTEYHEYEHLSTGHVMPSCDE